MYNQCFMSQLFPNLCDFNNVYFVGQINESVCLPVCLYMREVLWILTGGPGNPGAPILPSLPAGPASPFSPIKP